MKRADDETVFHLAVSNMALQHDALHERECHIAVHERHVALHLLRCPLIYCQFQHNPTRVIVYN